MTSREYLKIRAVRAEQGEGTGVYAFFLYGADINRIADISRVRREDSELKGFQRREIREHVKDITHFLDSGPVLFPNAIILAMSKEVEFASARGRAPGATVIQQTTGRLVQFEQMPALRASILAWLERRGGTVNDFVFPSRIDYLGHLNTGRR